ncbi:adenylate/guanylate cyclase domain-containing protein [Adhaeribacter pallidiroseus]|uniref:Adenylate cyclase n=1 Tax=Adhaeribacter pallidiroseus TaxID=2072847 RepID=A0A369QL90_9BACT|nr:adenylate/guanylate cyclase domain-containing protein [Adhaeribacter pallidiroseus]RDC64415.1 Adenylate cyclase [Adhaeribacter pallidiroseus]
MKKRSQIKLTQLRLIVVAWLLVGLFMSVYDHLVLHTANSQGPSELYSFEFSLILNLGSAFLGALLGGSFLVFYVNVKYPDKPYRKTILAVGTSYLLIILFIMLVIGVISVQIRTGKSFSDPVAQQAFKLFLLDSSRAKNILVWFLVVAFTQFLLQINTKLGPGELYNLIQGKYHTALEEKKIFMFLDINASTSIAEQLGDEQYHEFLKDFFADITNPILDNKGEIYQYVGDEVVVAWQYENGIENSQCLRCFFDIKQQIQHNRAKYLHRYGVVPSFKAGLHCGKVVAGEVGILKRDVTYSGNVLNTTSRIQSMCKEFKEEVIASADLLAELCLVNNFVAQTLGSIKLRGKEQEIVLSTVKPFTLL